MFGDINGRFVSVVRLHLKFTPAPTSPRNPTLGDCHGHSSTVFVSGAKRSKAKKAVVLLLSLSLAGEAEVPSHQEEGGRAVGCRCCQSKPRQFGHILFTMATPAIHLLLGQSKHPAKQTNKQTQNKSQTTDKPK